jgi:hypothetical protein
MVFTGRSVQGDDRGHEFIGFHFYDRENGGEDEIQLSLFDTGAYLAQVLCDENGHVPYPGSPETTSQIFHKGIEIPQELSRIRADETDPELLYRIFC